MAKCTDCKKEMLVAKGCSITKFTSKGRLWHRVRVFAVALNKEGRCHDCGAFPGYFHHTGCDMERCPSCGNQFLMCGFDCLKAEVKG